MEGLVLGRMCHYQEALAENTVAAAVVADVIDPQNGVVNLQVFHKQESGTYLAERVRYSAEPAPQTWRWMR